MRDTTVGVVVVNYNGGDLTLRCLDSLQSLEWPRDRLRVVLVDNNSTDGVADRVAAERPEVEVVRSPTNVGFAGGCNAGIRQLRGVDYVALLNNDAVAEPGWIGPLVETLDTDPTLGAACSKVLFDGQFVDVELKTPAVVPGRGDARTLGVRVSGARVDGADVWPRVHRVDGFWGPERDAAGQSYEWSGAEALLRLPLPNGGPAVGELLVNADRDTDVELVSGDGRRTHRIGAAGRWVEVPLAGNAFDVINSAGAILVTGGYGADRGYLERDNGQYDTEAEVFAWSGSAVLLSGRYLDAVGPFENDFFLYYEDFDLSWRGRLAGWRYRYVPASVVRHVHAATSGAGEGSPLFRHYAERNRLLTLTRNAPRAVAAAAPLRSLLITLSYARRDIGAPLLRGRSPRTDIPAWRLRALLAFVRLLPWAVRTRRRIRSTQSVSDEAILGWMVAEQDPVVGSKE